MMTVEDIKKTVEEDEAKIDNLDRRMLLAENLINQVGNFVTDAQASMIKTENMLDTMSGDNKIGVQRIGADQLSISIKPFRYDTMSSTAWKIRVAAGSIFRLGSVYSWAAAIVDFTGKAPGTYWVVMNLGSPVTATIVASSTTLGDGQYAVVEVVVVSGGISTVTQLAHSDIVDNGDYFGYKRFRLDYVSTLKVKINAGIYRNVGTTKFTKADTDITGIGNDVDGYAAAFVAGQHYVWLELHHASTDEQLTADTLKIMCATALSEDTRNRNLYWPLGTFTVALDNTVNPLSIVRYWIGDVDNVTPIPDAELVPALAYPLKTIEWRHANFYEWQAYDADEGQLYNGATPPAGTAWTSRWGIAGIPKDVNGGGLLAWVGLDGDGSGVGVANQRSIEIDSATKVWQIYKMDQASEYSADTMDFCLRTGVAGEVVWCDWSDVLDRLEGGLSGDTSWIAVINALLSHHLLDSKTDGGTGDFHDGGGNVNKDHHPMYWYTYDVGAQVDNKNFHTTGECRADDFIIQDATTNTWNAAGFDFSVSDDAGFTTVADLAMAIGAASVWIVEGGLTIKPSGNSHGDFNLGTTAPLKYTNVNLYAVTAMELRVGDNLALYGDDTTSLYLGGGAGTTFSNIYFNNVAGIDQATGGGTPADIVITKGGVTGLSLVAHANDGTYANPTSITISHGIITAIS